MPRFDSPSSVVRNRYLRAALACGLSVALLLVSTIPALTQSEVTTQSRSQDNQRLGNPQPGRPEATLPDLELVRREGPKVRPVVEAVPSTMRSRKNAMQPWDGRKFGDPLPGQAGNNSPNSTLQNGEARAEVAKRAHAKRRVRQPEPPTVLDDAFIDNFYQYALPSYTPHAQEKPYWRDQLRAAYNHGPDSVRLAAIEMGKTLFESAAYAERVPQRNDHDYVWDLYATYLMRDASQDVSGWNFWTGVVATSGRENVRRAFEECTEFANLMATLVPNGSLSGSQSSLITARVEPQTQPGNGLLTRDATWSLPLVSLPGRSGLDLGLSLSYSSQVWTKSGPFIYFDEDNGFPSPGFRLGFPTIQRKNYDAQTNANSYLMITSSGHRVDLRQVGTSNMYEAADSSYLQLTDNGSSWVVRSTDGTQLLFAEFNNEYHCTQVKDRNGNYLSVNYDGWGHITTITDTLGRVINFNYDSNANLLSISQTWNGQTHNWVTFGWTSQTVQSGFSSTAVRVSGTANGVSVPVINQVAFPNGDYFQLDYNDYLQVSAYRRYNTADNPAFIRFQEWFGFDGGSDDLPRIISSNLNVFNWTGINGIPGNVTTIYSVADGAHVLTTPEGTIYKEYYGTGWQKGLTTLSEVWSGGVKQKSTIATWTQDNTSVGYQMNPRVTETNVYDSANNRRRTTIEYYTQFGLPHVITEYAADGTNALRFKVLDYKNDSVYVDRRIIGLLFRDSTLDGSWNLQAKTEYAYDWNSSGDLFQDTPAAATQHDRTNYGPSFVEGRGNLSWIGRYDVTDPNNTNNTVTETKYRVNSTGSVLMERDHLWHQKFIAYSDSFSDSVNRNTFAYPTTLTDEDGNSSYVQYNFDFGATTRTQGPPPAGQSQGAIQTMTYTSAAELEKITTVNTNAYKRFWYGPDYIGSFATVNNVADEAFTYQSFDGLGRLMGVASNHPNSTGGYKGQTTNYDVMGRSSKVTNPTEIMSNWVPTGEDTAGWNATGQTYDWKGRRLITTNPDGTTKEASYNVCGCAGSEVVTLTDEGVSYSGPKRQQKIYSDVLGRTIKTEILNWQGGGVYSATVNTYNALDQLTQVRQYAGAEGSGTYQDTTMTYDGYGRLQTKHLPEQSTGTSTVWTYNADDTVQAAADARGAVTTYVYNSRHLVTNASSALSGLSTINVTNSYDAAGNRTAMTHSVGGVAKDSATFSYDQLSRLTSETRHVNALESYWPNYGSFTISYGYTLSGQLQSVTDPFSAPTSFSYDTAGRTSGVTGSWNGVNYTYASNISYRAWGAVKSASLGGATETISYNSRMQPSHFWVGSMSYDYSYFDDGKLRTFKDLNDQIGDPHYVQFHYMSRAYAYDHVGRIAGVSQLPNYSVMPPFTGSYGYDEFNNLTSRGGQYALNSPQSDPQSGTTIYANNRRNGWTYNAEGQVTSSSDTSDSGGSSTRTWTYDAAGKLVFVSEVRNGQTTTVAMGYDGDGELIGEIFNGSTSDYLIRSSVLGTVLTKLTTTGGKDTTYVPAHGLVAPMQKYDPYSSPQSYMIWVYRDPLGIQESSNGYLSAYDPFGNLVSNVQPPVSGPPPYMPVYGATYGGLSWNSFANANNLAAGCNVGGFPMDCSRAMIGAMGLEFAMNLPGLHLDNINAEANHVGNFALKTRTWVKDPAGPDFDDRGYGRWTTINWGSNYTLDSPEPEPQNPPTTRDPLEVKKQFYDLHGKDLNDCIKKVFKGDAAKVPTQTILNAPALNVHRTRRQLGTLAGGGRPIGYSGEGGPTDTIYIARDVFNGNTPNTKNAIFGTYAHELGVILDIKLNPSPPPGTLGMTYGDPNDPEDKDTGAAIEKCLFGSLHWP